MSNDDFGEFATNPYASTATLETTATPYQSRQYGGIGRLAYFGLSFLAQLVINAMEFVVRENADLAVILFPLAIVSLGIAMWLGALRMINAGYSGWWCLGLMVPILNILVGVRALACPEGYADHGVLDTAGKIVVGLFIALIVVVVVLVAIAVSMG